MDNIEELNPFSIIYPTAMLRHWQELKESGDIQSLPSVYFTC